MPSLSGRFDDNQIRFDATVSICGAQNPTQHSYVALLDTGAQRSMISPRVVSEVGLDSVGLTDIQGIEGRLIEAETFRVTLDVPIPIDREAVGRRIQIALVNGKDLDVTKLPFQPHNYDVLLGMDFISSFHMTIYGDWYVISN